MSEGFVEVARETTKEVARREPWAATFIITVAMFLIFMGLGSYFASQWLEKLITGGISALDKNTEATAASTAASQASVLVMQKMADDVESNQETLGENQEHIEELRRDFDQLLRQRSQMIPRPNPPQRPPS